MTIFFLLVGLEIKRELLVGELAKPRQAILPMMAAFGGVLFPTLLFIIWTWGTPALRGWGVPMATDIAFALGLLALFGKGIPSALKVFLAALAIVDDLIAVVVIALFYSDGINLLALLVSAGLLVCLLCCNVMGVRCPLVYVVLGMFLWVAVLQSGVHATIAGVLLAFSIPARSRIDAPTFVQRSREVLDEFEQSSVPGVGLMMDDRQQTAVAALEEGAEKIQAPLQRIEHALHVPVSFVVIPLFVLANAGVSFDIGTLSQAVLSPVSLGVFLGLVLGKQIGVTLFSWVAVRLNWAQLPTGVRWGQVYGIGWLAGIGCTMSLFIGELAFGEEHPALLSEAKMGILLALIVASIGGYLVLRTARPSPESADPSPADQGRVMQASRST